MKRINGRHYTKPENVSLWSYIKSKMPYLNGEDIANIAAIVLLTATLVFTIMGMVMARARNLDTHSENLLPLAHCIYGPIDYRPSAFHHYSHTPTVPRCRQERST